MGPANTRLRPSMASRRRQQNIRSRRSRRTVVAVATCRQHNRSPERLSFTFGEAMKMNTVLGNRRMRLVLLGVGVLAGMIAWMVWSVGNRSRVRPPDPARVRAWEKIAPRLQVAQTRDAEISAKYAQRISDFFAE